MIGASALAVGGCALILVAAAVGPYPIPLSHTTSALLDWAGLGRSGATATEQAIVETVRLPRIAAAFSVGAALAASGVVLQGLFRNPMADPGIIGVSAGGALGAVAAIATGAAAASALALPAMAFAGATGAVLLVYAIAAAGGRSSMAALLLAGVAVTSFLGAIVSAVIVFTSEQQAQREMVFWLAGGLDSTGWEDVRIVLPVVLVGVAGMLIFARDLNLLLVSEDDARSLGVRVGLTRNVLIVCASLVTGVAVAFSGTIAFVGLVVPHALRLVLGADHRVLLPLSAIGGGVFLLAADTVARTVASPAEVRVGIVTALAGAPFFVFLLLRHKSRAGAL